MAKGFGGMGGMNMNALMKQAQKMQKQMEETQAALAEQVIETTSGGGAVKVSVTAKKELKAITINPDVVDPDDVEMLEDLIMAETNEALRKCEEESQAQMSKITGGLSGLGGGLF